MKTSEEMINTNRMVFKLDNGDKVAIDRLKCYTSNEYVLTIPWYMASETNEITEDDTLLVRKIIFFDKSVTISGLLIKNFSYRIMHFNNKGIIDTFYENYSPMPEERTFAKNVAFRVKDISEFCTDLDMYEGMLDEKMIDGDIDDLAKYGLYKKPSIRLIKSITKNK